jgi:hypothetical protein
MNSFQGSSPSPAGSNISGTGVDNPLWAKYYNAGLQNVGAGSCRYFSLVQKMAMDRNYFVPLVGPNFDVFFRKAAVSGMPNWSPDVFGFPWWTVNAK